MQPGDARDLLAGYVTGPAAATEATAVALARADGARTVVLVEGVSDQIAVEALAGRLGRDLATEGVTVLPAGGAHGFGGYLRRFGPLGAGARLAGLYDAGAQRKLRYARLLTEAVDLDQVPRPLACLLAAV
jgi:Overcoming lysogenization defect protein-like, TOPRIM domain